MQFYTRVKEPKIFILSICLILKVLPYHIDFQQCLCMGSRMRRYMHILTSHIFFSIWNSAWKPECACLWGHFSVQHRLFIRPLVLEKVWPRVSDVWRRCGPGYLVFGEGMDQGAIDVIDGDAERHDDDILGCGFVQSFWRMQCSRHGDVVRWQIHQVALTRFHTPVITHIYTHTC